jgi:hypothetical protein
LDAAGDSGSLVESVRSRRGTIMTNQRDDHARDETGRDDVRRELHRDDRTVPLRADAAPHDESGSLRDEVVDREKREYGGFKFGSAFFGWLTAMGMSAILTALVAATGAALGLGIDPNAQANLGEEDTTTIGIVGAVILVVVVLIAYFCGGYVAGRMARFDGLKQGLAVWLWAIVIAIVIAVVTAIAGSQLNILANLDVFPRIPINEGALTTTGILTAVALLLASLGGALLGGVAGMRFHRKVDRAGLGR